MSRELLEKAAKAAGYEPRFWGDSDGWWTLIPGEPRGRYWNPIDDDGDAFRLAVKLKMLVGKGECDCCIEAHCEEFDEPIRVRYSDSFRDCETTDPYAATRLAIVRAAAAIGEAMK